MTWYETILQFCLKNLPYKVVFKYFLQLATSIVSNTENKLDDKGVELLTLLFKEWNLID